MAVKPNLELHIEELVLHGFSPYDARYIGEAVERELGRLFEERGVPPLLNREGHFPRLNLDSIQLSAPLQAETAGAAIAQTIYQGFNVESAPATDR